MITNTGTPRPLDRITRITPNTRSFAGHPLGRMLDADYLFCRITVCLYLLIFPAG